MSEEERAVAHRRDRPVLLFVVNVAWFFCMHRLHLARAAQAAGFEVHVATAPDTPEDVARIEAMGLRFHPLALQRGRRGMVEELRLTRQLYLLYRAIRPDIVHHVTIKPVLMGTLAARAARLPAIINAMSGLGFVFTAVGGRATARRKAVTSAYRVLFASSRVRVIFENNDDLVFFTRGGVVRRERAALIRGAGVDLQRFRWQRQEQDPPLVVLPARMLWDKGVREFCEAAAGLRKSGVLARFALVGGLDAANPAAIPEAWLNEQTRGGAVEWWGHRQDIAAVYSQARIACLPSYREGLPTVLLEAAASGCALITTDVPGCREVVKHAETGLLVPARDSVALADALATLIADAPRCVQLASAARMRVVAEFSVETVRRDTLQLYGQALGSVHTPSTGP